MISRNTPALACKIEEFWATPEIKTTRVVWDGIVDVSADEALAAATPAKHNADSAATFLQDMLSGGQVLVKTIEERAALAGPTAFLASAGQPKGAR